MTNVELPTTIARPRIALSPFVFGAGCFGTTCTARSRGARSACAKSRPGSIMVIPVDTPEPRLVKTSGVTVPAAAALVSTLLDHGISTSRTSRFTTDDPVL